MSNTPGSVQLQKNGYMLEMSDLCTIYGAESNVLISCAVIAQLICIFVFAYAKRRFTHDAAHIIK